MGASIIRGALLDAEQHYLYRYLLSLAKPDSEEIQGLRMTARLSDQERHNPDNRPQPFVTWLHPYTRASNACEKPERLLRWAERIMHTIAPDSRSHTVDSMLAQM